MMNWLNKLLGKPTVAPAPPPPAKRLATPSPAKATETLRWALWAAASEDEQQHACGHLGRALAERRQAPLASDPPGVWVAAICKVADKALALLWLATVTGERWLAEVALHGGIAEVRLAALQRVEASVMLERIAQVSRGKDKRVYRQCLDRLRQRRLADQDTPRAERLTGELRSLLDRVPLDPSRLLELHQALGTLEAAGPLVAECAALVAQAQARFQQESLAQREIPRDTAAAQKLLDDFSTAESPPLAQLHDWRVCIVTLATAHAERPSWLSSQAAARTLADLLHDLEGRLTALDAEGENVLACEQFLATLTASEPMGTEAREQARAVWEALRKPENRVTRQALELRWQALHAPSDCAVPAVLLLPSARIDPAAVRSRLEKLEREVDEGQLAESEAAMAALNAILGGQSLQGDVQSRLQRAHAQLGQLRGWARWSSEQARDSLITAAEHLSLGSMSLDDRDQSVKSLRKKWQQLKTHGPSAKDQWQSFDAALKKAYQPVAAHREAEAARQTAACAAKVALCDEWASSCSAIVWASVDYTVLEAQRQDILRRWRAADQANISDERRLRDRFDTLLKGIDQRLNAVRASERQRLDQLVGEAEALRETADLGRAIKAARMLQDRWTQDASPLRLARDDEQALWRRFRVACAEVFERRDVQRDRQVAQREAQTQAAQDLLDALSATLAAMDPKLIQEALGRFRNAWKAATANSIGLAVGLKQRAYELQQLAQQRINNVLQEKIEANYGVLAKKAALAETVEAAAVAQLPTAGVVVAARTAWDGLQRLPGKTETLLAERLARATGMTAIEWAAGRKSREVMLLDLEIALALPSPDAFSYARRRRQLEHLQNRFVGDSPLATDPDPDALVVRWFATAAASDPALAQRLTAVTNKQLERAVKSSG